MEASNKPVILLDVDGPLNPYAAKPTKRPEGYETHRMTPTGWVATKPLKVWLNPLHGPRIMSLGYEVIWATTWEEDANVWIGPHIGLPELPVIDWIDKDTYNPEKLHWKTKRIASWMNENRPNTPYIWVDDEVMKKDLDYLTKNSSGTARIMPISPRIGLDEPDFEYLIFLRDKL